MKPYKIDREQKYKTSIIKMYEEGYQYNISQIIFIIRNVDTEI